RYKITHGVVSPHIDPLCDKFKGPGPGAHADKSKTSRYKQPPSYTMRPAARPPYQPWDQWTPPPNMYYPPIPAKKPPAYTLGSVAKDIPGQDLPGPGEHDPNFNYVKNNKPAYSFGHSFKQIKPSKSPHYASGFREQTFVLTLH
ncbi:Outer dense fiber protein 3-B, partial [Operophtera brumata]